MSEKSALIVWGGWDGHEPEQVAAHFADVLEKENFDVTVSDTLDAFLNHDLNNISLIVPVWTMGEITGEQCKAVCDAVNRGTGIAGCHGGMCDSFRNNTEWQFLTGGQWVAHPGDTGVTYTVNMVQDHEITRGIKDFQVTSEQYYLHTDPGNNVLATTDFPNPSGPGPHTGNPCKMPQVWTKSFGKGRVFYNALGHNRALFDIPEATELMRRGFLWAAR
ncbi:MAG TPA: ThuA domain-containing protein [Fimbriimonadaceae bacterium]|nr:ThuA domain-containing protein [Fimbriimonadaceae bacterium]